MIMKLRNYDLIFVLNSNNYCIKLSKSDYNEHIRWTRYKKKTYKRNESFLFLFKRTNFLIWYFAHQSGKINYYSGIYILRSCSIQFKFWPNMFCDPFGIMPLWCKKLVLRWHSHSGMKQCPRHSVCRYAWSDPSDVSKWQ